ncbi:DinB superfamily protein [Planctomycetes bacterium MalM25]|nr:DinB superfamily protein [Planctomycetes bacterium MalM25]
MDPQKIFDSLERFGRQLPGVVEGLAGEDARWKPSPRDWSVLEVVSHLADEEELDFRRRLRWVLDQNEGPWPPIDPEGWAVERRYNEGDLSAATERFRTQRAKSVAWLRSLGEVNWDLAYQHPEFGPIRAGDLLGSWCCHDQLHLRQITKRLYQLAARDAGEYTVLYAGPW